MNNTATATAKETVRRPAPAAPSSAGNVINLRRFNIS